jgi:hypothetical protein
MVKHWFGDGFFGKVGFEEVNISLENVKVSTFLLCVDKVSKTTNVASKPIRVPSLIDFYFLPCKTHKK